MEDDEFPAISPDVDLNKILPIHQKRIIAFINHFIMTTVSFLNTFAQSCESMLMDFEYKIQKVEASLLILEAQLSSINGLENKSSSISNVETSATLDLPDVAKHDENKENLGENKTNETPKKVKASEDPKLSHFFKMLHVGVPLQAVKLKMEQEGFDPTVLDEPRE